MSHRKNAAQRQEIVGRYRKLIVALLGALSVAVADGLFDPHDAVNVVIAVLTAAGSS